MEPKLYALTIAGGRLGTAIVRNLFLQGALFGRKRMFYDGCLFLLYPFAFSFFSFSSLFYSSEVGTIVQKRYEDTNKRKDKQI